MPKRSKILIFLGLSLVFVSLVLLVVSWIIMGRSENRVENIINRLDEILPERSAGVEGEYSDMNMPVLDLDGEDIVAVVSVPAFQSRLPVGNAWKAGGIASYPRRFSGTVYDGSLVIGGSDGKGQFDFFEKLDLGMSVTVTDMTGAEFSYTVSGIDRSSTATADVLQSEDASLTLFARDSYSMEYIIVRLSNSVD